MFKAKGRKAKGRAQRRAQRPIIRNWRIAELPNCRYAAPYSFKLNNRKPRLNLTQRRTRRAPWALQQSKHDSEVKAQACSRKKIKNVYDPATFFVTPQYMSLKLPFITYDCCGLWSATSLINYAFVIGAHEIMPKL